MESGASGAVAGLLLAAGGGRRMGRPKALVRSEGGVPWLTSATSALIDADCDPVVVVLGAAAAEARSLLPDDARVVVTVAEDWASGMSASLAAGLDTVTRSAAHAALITLVDLPGLPIEALLRVRGQGAAASALRQTVYDGRPGHPVLIGREHWRDVARSVTGDSGARDYLAAHGAEPVECGDLWHGRDVDRRP